MMFRRMDLKTSIEVVSGIPVQNGIQDLTWIDLFAKSDLKNFYNFYKSFGVGTNLKSENLKNLDSSGE